MGAGNTSVLMQLLVGMLDAALARQQDLVAAAAARGGRAEDRRGAAGPQPRLRRDDGAEALGGPGDGRLLADRRAVGRSRGARPARRAVRPPRLLRDRLRARRARRGRADDGRSSPTPCGRASSDLSALGRPDVRLHLPRHHAIASWSTPSRAVRRRSSPRRSRCGRPRASRAARAPVSTSAAARQLTDLRQPHWDRDRAATTSRPSSPPAADAAPRAPARAPGRRPGRMPAAAARPRGATAALPQRPQRATASSSSSTAPRACAGRARATTAGRARARSARPRDAGAGRGSGTCSAARSTAASTAPARATTTQRRLKRLADAGLCRAPAVPPRATAEEYRCAADHRRGGVTCSRRHERLPAGLQRSPRGADAPRSPQCGRSSRLRQARRDVHVAGWTLASALRLGRRRAILGRRGVRDLTAPALDGERTRRLGPRTCACPAAGCRTTSCAPRPTAGEDRGRALRDRAPGATVRDGRGRPAARARRSPPGRGRRPAARALRPLPVGLVAAAPRRYGRRAEATPRSCSCAATVSARASSPGAPTHSCAHAAPMPASTRFDWDYPGRRRLLFVRRARRPRRPAAAYGVPRCRRRCAWGPPTVTLGPARRASRRSSFRARRDRAGSAGSRT